MLRYQHVAYDINGSKFINAMDIGYLFIYYTTNSIAVIKDYNTCEREPYAEQQSTQVDFLEEGVIFFLPFIQ